MSGISLQDTLFYLLRHCLSLNLELANLASQSSLPAYPGVYLYLLPRCQDHRWTTRHVWFYVASLDSHSVLRAV